MSVRVATDSTLGPLIKEAVKSAQRSSAASML